MQLYIRKYFSLLRISRLNCSLDFAALLKRFSLSRNKANAHRMHVHMTQGFIHVGHFLNNILHTRVCVYLCARGQELVVL